ncbi:hypothetical protein BDZ90DRAFT_232569 [Jaminaea rosea]|uniref:BZIP domain-containing protein n=1 Tax=Jaminaea rosea TaxID=1569628 RepID=A0A316UNZ4_9BASI|nr:hypothetical protein BDZ90DRAFT_232569 [Jaminaea rosea]PWN26990.1 hypothetical protein BDZ90DRAFT_232569 [Jaminaea rosea]
MPPAKKRKSPYDRFTDASPTAISAGFAAAMNIGPQPRGIQGGTMAAPSSSNLGSSSGDMGVDPFGQQGADWLQSLQNVSGVASGNGFGEEDEGEGDDDEPDTPSTSAAKGNAARGGVGAKRRRGGGQAGSKRGKAAASSKEAPSTAADDDDEAAQHRKEQNRLAQREFRQRRQQYVRALEGRIELLSSDHDDQVDRLRHALRGLLAENNTLRSMVGSLARFIGEGLLGGPLQQNGISRQQLEEMINGRSEKTMTDAWQNWPGAKECEALRQIRMEANIPADGLPEMRNSSPGAMGAGAGGSAKKSRKSTGGAAGAGTAAGTSSTTDDNTAGPSQQPSASGAASANAFAEPFLAPYINASTASMPSSSTAAPSFAGNTPFNGGAPFSPFPFAGGSDQPDAALLASLFGPASVTSQSGAWPAPTPSTLDTNSRDGPSLGNGSTITGNGSTSALPSSDSPATTPRTALQNSAHTFLQSLRHLDEQDRSGLARVQSIADQLNHLRASQGRRDLISLFGDAATASASPRGGSGANTNDSTIAPASLADDGGSPQTEEEMSRMTSAFIQTAYHMANYRRNASYRLPSILRPTDLQLTRPHDPIIDGVPLSGLRDALIEQHAQGRVDLDEVLFYLLCSTKMAEGDVLRQETWMLDHGFVLRFPSLATSDVLDATNRWRKVTHDLEPLSKEDVLQLAGKGRRAGMVGREKGTAAKSGTGGVAGDGAGVSSAEANASGSGSPAMTR